MSRTLQHITQFEIHYDHPNLYNMTIDLHNEDFVDDNGRLLANLCLKSFYSEVVSSIMDCHPHSNRTKVEDFVKNTMVFTSHKDCL